MWNQTKCWNVLGCVLGYDLDNVLVTIVWRLLLIIATCNSITHLPWCIVIWEPVISCCTLCLIPPSWLADSGKNNKCSSSVLTVLLLTLWRYSKKRRECLEAHTARATMSQYRVLPSYSDINSLNTGYEEVPNFASFSLIYSHDNTSRLDENHQKVINHKKILFKLRGKIEKSIWMIYPKTFAYTNIKN